MKKVLNDITNRETPENITKIGAGEILVYETDKLGNIDKGIIDLVYTLGGTPGQVNELNGWSFPLYTHNLNENELRFSIIDMQEWISLSETLIFYIPEIKRSKVAEDKIVEMLRPLWLFENVTLPKKYINKL